MSSELPQLVAFDLDYTLWDLWIDTHATGPLRRDKDKVNEVLDRYGEVIKFYKDVPEVLHRLREANVTIAACSRTHAPNLQVTHSLLVARQALSLLLVPPAKKDDAPMAAVKFFDQQEIFPGSKMAHFKNLHEKTGIPYSQMLFFDDEHRNAEVEKLGVTFFLVTRGLSSDAFERGLAKWRRNNGSSAE